MPDLGQMRGATTKAYCGKYVEEEQRSRWTQRWHPTGDRRRYLRILNLYSGFSRDRARRWPANRKTSSAGPPRCATRSDFDDLVYPQKEITAIADIDSC